MLLTPEEREAIEDAIGYAMSEGTDEQFKLWRGASSKLGIRPQDRHGNELKVNRGYVQAAKSGGTLGYPLLPGRHGR